MNSRIAPSHNEVLEVFQSALSQWQEWIAADTSRWHRLGLQNDLLFEDISKLQLFAIEGQPGALFNHKAHERRFELCHSLLNAYAGFWSHQRLVKEKRQLMAELFLLHEFSHVPQDIGSSTYFIGGRSSVDFFSRLDYSSDAFALDLCYSRYSKQGSGIDQPMLLKLLECQYLGGHVFGSVERTEATSSGPTINGSRMRRQLVWALQYARSESFPPEQPFAEFQLRQEVGVQLFPSRSGLGTDLCDSNEVTASDLVPPLLLSVLLGGTAPERLRHTISTEREAAAFRSLLLEAKFDSATECFRPFFKDRPALVGRAPGQLVAALNSKASSKDARTSVDAETASDPVGSIAAPSLLTTQGTILVRRLDVLSGLTERDAAIVSDFGNYVEPRNLGILYVEREIEVDIVSTVLQSPPGAILIYGEAGSGKTSLLWNLYKRLKDKHSNILRPWFVKATTAIAEFSPEEIGESIQVVRRMGCTPVLLIDTVDLILYDSAKRTHFLKINDIAAEHGAWIIVTCRPREARKYLASMAAKKLILGDYTDDEFEVAIKRHVEHYCPRAGVISQLDQETRLKDAVIRGKPVREVCLRPLTLWMLFSMYGPGGDVPTDINGAHLYDKYWEWRVKSDCRSEDPYSAKGSADLSRAAEIIATEMLAEGEIEIHRSHARLPGKSYFQNRNFADDVETLVARGVLHVHESRIEFFHQTFFEHAAARGMLGELVGSPAGLATLANRCQTHPYDLLRAPVLEQALILSSDKGIEYRAVAYEVIDKLLNSPHTAHLVTAAYVYPQMAGVPPKTREAAKKAMLAHPEVATRFIASIPSIPPERSSEVFPELDFIWVNLVAPKLESSGKWAGGRGLIEQLRRLAVREGKHAEGVIAFMRRHDVVRLVLKEKDVVDQLLRVIETLAPYSPENYWNSLVFLYQGAPDEPTSSALRAIVTNSLAKEASSLGSRQVATDFDVAAELGDPSQGLDLGLNRAWGFLWAVEWNADKRELEWILSQITSQSNQVRLVRQLYGLAHLLSGYPSADLAGGLQKIWPCFLAKENQRHRTTWIKFWKELLEPSTRAGGNQNLDACEEFLVESVADFLDDPHTENRRTATQFIKQLLNPGFSEKVTKRLVTDPAFDGAERWLDLDDLGPLLPTAYLLEHPGAKSLVVDLTIDPTRLKTTVRENLLSMFAARAELGSAAALDILFRFAETVTEARKKILLVLKKSEPHLDDDNPFFNVVLEHAIRLNAMCVDWLSSSDIGDHRNAAKLLRQIVRYGVGVSADPRQFYERYQAEADNAARVQLAIFMGAWASHGGDVENAISALTECAASSEQHLSSTVLAELVQCATKHGKLPVLAKGILGIALSVKPTEKRLIEAARMIKELAPSHFSLATEVLEEFVTSQAVMAQSDTVTMTLRRTLPQTFKAWVLHSSQLDRKRLIDKIHEMVPNLACLVLTVVCDEHFDEMSEGLNAIESNESIDTSIKRHILKLRKEHGERTQSDPWPELRDILPAHY